MSRNSRTISPEYAESTVAEMRELFGIDNCAFVVDRGMASFDNFRFIESLGCTYLDAFNSDTLRSMKFPEASAFSHITVEDARALADQLDDIEDPKALEIPEELSDFALYAQGRSFYRTIATERERHILVFNPKLCVTRKQDRQDKTAKAKAENAGLNRDAASAAESRQLEPLRNKVTKVLFLLKLTQIFEPAFDEVLIARNAKKGSKPSQIRTYRARLAPCPKAVDLEAHDGLYCLCTNVPEPSFRRNRP